MTPIRANFHVWSPQPQSRRFRGGVLHPVVNTITWLGFVSDCMEWVWPERYWTKSRSEAERKR